MKAFRGPFQYISAVKGEKRQRAATRCGAFSIAVGRPEMRTTRRHEACGTMDSLEAPLYWEWLGEGLEASP